MNEALTINGDGAQRNPDIHWPKGQHPEDADLYANNEIMVNASCETVFANIVDAQSWPSWYPNSHNVVVHDSPDNKFARRDEVLLGHVWCTHREYRSRARAQ